MGKIQRMWAGRRGLPLMLLVAVDISLPLLVAGGLLAAGAHWLHSLPLSYNLLSQHIAPDDPVVQTKKAPALAWLLSVYGWLLVPAVVGAIAAEVVTAIVEKDRGVPLEDAVVKARERERRRKPS